MILALILCASGSACDRPKPAHVAAQRGEPDAIYTTRGKVEQIPEKSRAGSELIIYHEPVSDFKDADGAIIGMNSMSMPFPVAPGVSIESIAVGDFVSLTFAVWMKPGDRAWELRSIRVLPSDTKLSFGRASAQETKKPSAGQELP